MDTVCEYSLADVRADVVDGAIRISALAHGPKDSSVWVRAWLSNQSRTLSETALDPVDAGTSVVVDVPIPTGLDPDDAYAAYIRIESAPLETRQVVAIPIDFSSLRLFRK